MLAPESPQELRVAGQWRCVTRIVELEHVVRFFRRSESSPALARLRSLKLFASLSWSELQVVESFHHERTYLPNEVVFDEGEDGQAIYAIIDGQVNIVRWSGEHAVPLASLGAGDFFGELALLENAPRAAQARALSECRLIVFFRADFMSLLETHPKVASKIALQLARHLGGRLREANRGTSVEGHL